VDVDLRVVVRQAQGTIIGFKPGQLHGTTHLFGAHNLLTSINFSSHILQAYQNAQKKNEAIAGSGPKQGDPNDY
jgi:hypothetical protein